MPLERDYDAVFGIAPATVRVPTNGRLLVRNPVEFSLPFFEPSLVTVPRIATLPNIEIVWRRLESVHAELTVSYSPLFAANATTVYDGIGGGIYTLGLEPGKAVFWKYRHKFTVTVGRLERHPPRPFGGPGSGDLIISQILTLYTEMSSIFRLTTFEEAYYTPPPKDTGGTGTGTGTGGTGTSGGKTEVAGFKVPNSVAVILAAALAAYFFLFKKL